jgi:hypothetical protein
MNAILSLGMDKGGMQAGILGSQSIASKQARIKQISYLFSF